jgi:hypothetical protein
VAEPRQDVALAPVGEDRRLTLPSRLLTVPEAEWLQPPSLPREPLPRWEAEAPRREGVIDEPLPLLFPGEGTEPRWSLGPEGARLDIDILGSVFFLVTRYEEVASPAPDPHGRFLASASVTVREGLLERPLAEEYARVLGWALRQLWPQLRLPPRRGGLLLSHDVDVPFQLRGRGWRELLRVTRRRVTQAASPGSASSELLRVLASKARLRADAYDTYDFLMQTAERAGLKTAFYFQAGASDPRYDVRYRLDSPRLTRLLERIRARGHEIGLHPSYRTFERPELLRQEWQRLRGVCAGLGIEQDRWGGRQHYLRWSPQTWRVWSEAGLDYDSSVAYAAQVGFRAGVASEYTAFDLAAGVPLRLVERPLIAMDATLLEPGYMGFDWEAARARLFALRDRCRRYGGQLTLLWHNDRLDTPAKRAAFAELVQELAW